MGVNRYVNKSAEYGFLCDGCNAESPATRLASQSQEAAEQGGWTITFFPNGRVGVLCPKCRGTKKEEVVCR